MGRMILSRDSDSNYYSNSTYSTWRNDNEQYYKTNRCGIRGPESQRQIVANSCASIIQELRSGQISMYEASSLLDQIFIFNMWDNMGGKEAIQVVVAAFSFSLAIILLPFLFIGFFFFVCFFILFSIGSSVLSVTWTTPIWTQLSREIFFFRNF